MVLECGLGGRLDATNIIKKPECVVISSIGYDHMEKLGNTLPEIAGEKSKIIKEGAKGVIIGPSCYDNEDVKRVFVE